VRRKSAAPTRPLSTRTAWLIADGVTPKLRGCSAKVAVLGNAQERLHAVERALPDCEVLLHALSTLSRIVVRRKRSYIWPANRRSADAETQKPRQRPQALKEPSP
jgi:hypothetical protein